MAIFNEFPRFTRREAAADLAVHVVGIAGALLGAAWLITRTTAAGTKAQIVASALYAMGLVGMVTASAAYNLTPPGPGKAVLRRIDHATIFVMIAGSYTPFALCALQPPLGPWLFAAAWLVAVIGAGLKLWLGNRYGPAFLALYLAHGWMLLGVIRPVAASLAPADLALLVAGGLVYSAGVVVHTRERLPFKNPIWHTLVLAAAGLHLAAIAGVMERAGIPTR